LVAEGAELFATRRHALQSFVSESEKFLVQLQQLIFASLLMLLIFGAWGVRVIYRDMISPLRVRLIETREIAERQEKLAALGVLAAGVAHEIRNPLTAIKARLYTLQKTLPVESAARRDAEFIGKEIDRLARIIADFLTFARPAQPRLESISAAELMSNAGELLAPGLLDDEIALVVEPAPGLKVSADAGQLQQVLINLVQNAAESIGKRGTISLRARSAELPLSGQIRDVVILEVEDTGKGIPREVQERLFDPFFTTKASGMGLGLSIAARIVEMHGGAIQYQTQVARGAKFGVVLPDGIAK
jgi:signal transduction histidine kinase